MRDPQTFQPLSVEAGSSAQEIAQKAPGAKVVKAFNTTFAGTLADGTKKSVGVVLPASLTFNTGAPEIMECVGGACEYKLAGSNDWVSSKAGEKFSVPGQSSFDIRVTEAYHYICHFG